jgi:uncharacterized protein (DUF1684 family)
MSEYLDLYDFRLRVKAMYAQRNEATLAGEDAQNVLERFRRQKDAIFASHPQSALDQEQRQHFTGLRYFPYNPALRFAVTVNTQVEPLQQQIMMNAQETMCMTTIGSVHFLVEDTPVSLSLYWLDIYGGGLFLPFRDTTCPQSSYGGGRYLFDTIKGNDTLFLHAKDNSLADIVDTEARLVLDFNYAYNPSCAYNDHWTCPLAPVENRLTVPITAGEMKYKE